jgi:hypothetical protein
MIAGMAEEIKPPPTYDELVTQNADLQAYALRLEEVARNLQAGINVRDAEIQRLALKAGKKPARQLDPKAASAFDRPWNGR